jgi:hypothetical protein
MAQVNFKFVSNTKGLQDGVKKGQKSLKGFESTTKKVSSGIGKALGGLGLAFGAAALFNGLKNAAKAAADDLKQQKLLAGQLVRTTKASKGQIKGAEKFIDTLSKQTGILDDDLRPALANAVRGSGSLEKGQKLLQIALDGSVASGEPLDTVLNALIKANNGNTTSLYKLAPELKKAKGGIDDYAKSVKGAAEDGADPFSRLQVAFEGIQERLGTLLLPLVEKFADFVIDTLAPAIEDFFDKINDPNTQEGQIFLRLKQVVEKVWEQIVEIATDPRMLKSFERVLDVVIKILDALEVINSFDWGASKEVKTVLPSLGNYLFTPENAKKAAAKMGVTLTDKQALAASKDLIGGADGKESTPWPMARGGIVMPRPGGTLARIGEAGRPEAVIPLDRFGSMGGNTYVININKANVSGNEIVAAIQRYERGTGRRYLTNG